MLKFPSGCAGLVSGIRTNPPNSKPVNMPCTNHRLLPMACPLLRGLRKALLKLSQGLFCNIGVEEVKMRVGCQGPPQIRCCLDHRAKACVNHAGMKEEPGILCPQL